MCGIVASFKSVDPIGDTLAQYDKQKSRGYEGFGFIALRDARIVKFARRTHEAGIRKEFDAVRHLEPDTILFHHRFPTSTANVPEAAHPLPIDKKGWKHRYYFIHNGVMSGGSEYEIKEEGYTFRSRVQEIKYYRAGGNLYERVESSDVNDSELLGYYVASMLEGERKDIPMTGAVAAFMLRENKKTKVCTLFAMRNLQNPLVVKRDKKAHSIMIASEVVGGELDAHAIHVLDWKTLTFSVERKVSIGTNYTGNSSGMGYMWDNDLPWLNGKPRTMFHDSANGGDVPTRDVQTQDALIIQELERRTREADKAYADYEEAMQTFGDDDSQEAKLYIEDAYAKWEEIEELRQELVDDEVPEAGKDNERLQKMQF